MLKICQNDIDISSSIFQRNFNIEKALKNIRILWHLFFNTFLTFFQRWNNIEILTLEKASKCWCLFKAENHSKISKIHQKLLDALIKHWKLKPAPVGKLTGLSWFCQLWCQCVAITEWHRCSFLQSLTYNYLYVYFSFTVFHFSFLVDIAK